jgi:hypothetical protein
MDKLERLRAEVTPLYIWRGIQPIGFFVVGLLAVLLVCRYLSLKMKGLEITGVSSNSPFGNPIFDITEPSRNKDISRWGGLCCFCLRRCAY